MDAFTTFYEELFATKVNVEVQKDSKPQSPTVEPITEAEVKAQIKTMPKRKSSDGKGIVAEMRFWLLEGIRNESIIQKGESETAR